MRIIGHNSCALSWRRLRPAFLCAGGALCTLWRPCQEPAPCKTVQSPTNPSEKELVLDHGFTNSIVSACNNRHFPIICHTNLVFFLCFPGQNDESTFLLQLLSPLNVDCHIDQIFQLLLSLIQLAFPSVPVLINGPILRRLSLALVDQFRYGNW